jgi:hypothetical protein
MKQTIACLSILCAAGAALAQSPALVNVDVAAVAPTIAKNINVEASKIPASVEVPVGIAAAACGLSASDLAMKSSGGAVSCQATTTSSALDAVVQKQLKVAAKQ